MPFMDLFSQPGSPLSLLSAGAPPMGTTPQGLQPSPASGGMLNLSGGTDQLPAMPFGPSSGAPGDIGARIQAAGANATPAFWNQLEGLVGQGSAPPSSSSISDLINSLLGKAPSIDDIFNSKPYEDAIAKLGTNKADAASGIGASYTKALAQLAAVTAAAKGDQAQFAQTTAANGAQAQGAQQAFLQSIGANGQSGSALGAMLQGQAARMATDQANQQNTTARLASVQNNDLSAAQQDAALGQMGALNQLNTATAGAQSKIGTQEATDRSTAMKELASMMAARQGQASSLLNNAETFIDKNTTSTNSRDAVQQQLAQMAQSGDGNTPSAFNSIVYGGDPDGKGGYTVGAKNQAEAIQRLQVAMPTLAQHGVDSKMLQQLINGFYTNSTAKQAPADIMDSLKQYLAALTGG